MGIIYWPPGGPVITGPNGPINQDPHAGMVKKPGESGNEASDWIPAPGGGGGNFPVPRYPMPEWPFPPSGPSPTDPHAGMVLKPGESGKEPGDWMPAPGGGGGGGGWPFPKFPDWPQPPRPRWTPGAWDPQNPPPFYRPDVDPGGYIPTDSQRQGEIDWYTKNWPGWGQGPFGGDTWKNFLLGGGTLGSIGAMMPTFNQTGNPFQTAYAQVGNTLGKLYGG